MIDTLDAKHTKLYNLIISIDARRTGDYNCFVYNTRWCRYSFILNYDMPLYIIVEERNDHGRKRTSVNHFTDPDIVISYLVRQKLLDGDAYLKADKMGKK